MKNNRAKNKEIVKRARKKIGVDVGSMRLPAKQKRSHKVIFKVDNVNKSFKIGKRYIKVLKDIDLCFYSGEFVIVFGPSGCGKSTLLHTMLGLEEPDKGRVYLRDKSVYQLTDENRLNWRREKIGIVFQQSNWIKSLSVLENVSYPLYLSDLGDKEIASKAMEMLKLVGLEKTAGQQPTELSGGEQQRVALARALVTDPGIIIADEPTGNLDSKSSKDLIGLLAKLNRKDRKAVIMVTHEDDFLPVANRRVYIKDGRVVGDEHD